MAEMRERWRTMPRAKQVAVALLLFWVAYLCAAAYEWTFGAPGGSVPLLDAAAVQVVRVTDVAPAAGGVEAVVAAPGREGFPIGDLAVVLAGAFMITGLAGVALVAWREIRGPVRQPGMGLGDDPLWLAGDLDA